MKSLYCSICGERATDTGTCFECESCGAEFDYKGNVICTYESDGDSSDEDGHEQQ